LQCRPDGPLADAGYADTQRVVINRWPKCVFNGFDLDEQYDLEADLAELHNVVSIASYRTKALNRNL
jgi:hypothetical protein